MEDLIARLLAKRQITEAGCWEWLGSRTNGYGRMWWIGRTHPVHRLAAHAWLGLDLSAGRSVVAMHQCDNPPCFNPDHLRLGTQQDNVDDAWEKGRAVSPGRAAPESCPHGHAYTEANTKWRNSRGRRYRICRTCWRDGERRRARALHDIDRQVPYRPRPSRLASAP